MSTTVGRSYGTGVNGEQGPGARPLGFSIMNTIAGRPAWWLHAPDGRLVAWSGAPLADVEEAAGAAEVFKARAEGARFEVYVDHGGSFRWRAWSRAARVAESGESFVGRAEAQRAAEDVRLCAGRSEGP